MKRRLFLFLFIASLLLVLGTIAAACGDDDGDESDEAANETAIRGVGDESDQAANESVIRGVIQEQARAVNDRDFDRLAELVTADFDKTAAFRIIMDDPDFRIDMLEFLSVTVDGDEATALVTHGGTHQSTDDTILLKREDGRWLVDIIRYEHP